MKRKPHRMSMSLTDLADTIGGHFLPRQPHTPMILHTGLGGAQVFEFIMKQEAGLIPRGKHSHSRLLYRIPGEYKVVDDRGEIWEWTIGRGHVIYRSTGQARIAGYRRPNARFTIWEESLSKGETPDHGIWIEYTTGDRLDYWRQRYNRKHK